MYLIIKIFFWIIIIVLIAFALFLLYITLTDYRPDSKEIIFQNSNSKLIDQDTFSLITWNIGYAGLGAEMDFFYDGGKMVRPSNEMSRKYLDGIKDYLKSNDSIDFFLLQEIDIEARRSHWMNEVNEIKALMTDHSAIFAKNYDVPFVPVPLYEPMGYVKGGLLSLSKKNPETAERYAYPLIASWPNRLFLLDRCFILNRYPLSKGIDLVVLNTHNSAYVYDSILREKEFEVIKHKMLEEYDKGNFVIAGGDWNANPPYFETPGYFNGHKFEPTSIKMNPNLLPEDWIWAFSPNAPTNRNNDNSYVKGENGTTYIDYFVVSPNIEVLKTKTIDLEFENADHNPVFIKIRLK